ncbi:MAG: hypothetical protein ACLUD0_08760 [Eubacterium ramulus]
MQDTQTIGNKNGRARASHKIPTTKTSTESRKEMDLGQQEKAYERLKRESRWIWKGGGRKMKKTDKQLQQEVTEDQTVYRWRFQADSKEAIPIAYQRGDRNNDRATARRAKQHHYENAIAHIARIAGRNWIE